ncbi:bacteriocin immunity protein [Sporolactobacillus laevolacticus]|uniref:bacteriocin immunity protein n=1 Tax=Sporolactobacillus laevolacticus TaxID=33018 RepID=UPI0025B2E7B0|nr:bacteriocin immunity protein [Sporolactobacillus laevolacticus]MDN3954699.1 bacteriocin immunity protein [Sporolactobacillus laevolacticus]
MLNKKKLSRKEQEDIILEKVYNLILDEQIQADERDVLITFKNHVEKSKDFEGQLMSLAEGLRQIAVQRLAVHSILSSQVGEFYMEISTTGLLKKNLGTGIAAMGITFH